jgi:hypothetical protein
VQGSVVLLSRVVDAMWEDAKAHARWICIDATGVLVFAQEKCRRNHFWVMVAERDHVIFRYTKTHNGLDPAKLLEGYCGYVIADASSVYHELYRREPSIIEVGCWSHYPENAVITALATIPLSHCETVGWVLQITTHERSWRLDRTRRSWHAGDHRVDASRGTGTSGKSCRSGARATGPRAPSAGIYIGCGAFAPSASHSGYRSPRSCPATASTRSLADTVALARVDHRCRECERPHDTLCTHGHTPCTSLAVRCRSGSPSGHQHHCLR